MLPSSTKSTCVVNTSSKNGAIPLALVRRTLRSLRSWAPYTPEFKKDLEAIAAYYKSIFEKKHLLTWALIRDSRKKGCGRKAHFILRAHLLGPNHIERMVVALENKISEVLWSAQDTKKDFLGYVLKHASFQSRAVYLKKTTTPYRSLSAEAKMRHFLHGIKGRELEVPLPLSSSAMMIA